MQLQKWAQSIILFSKIFLLYWNDKFFRSTKLLVLIQRSEKWAHICKENRENEHKEIQKLVCNLYHSSWNFLSIFKLLHILVQWLHQGVLKLEKYLNSIITLKASRSQNSLFFSILARRGGKQEKRMQWCSKIVTKPKITYFQWYLKCLNFTHLLLDSKQIPNRSWVTTP